MKPRNAPSRRTEGPLEAGREAYRDRDFTRAFELLSEADHKTPLGGDDLQSLALAAVLIGHEEEGTHSLERAHHAYSEEGKPLAAARTAIWLALRLGALGEKGRGSGWLARGKRLLEENEEDCVERGYLHLATARQALEARELEAASEDAAAAAQIGERFGEPDLIALARTTQGNVHLHGERFEEGLALLDEVMVAVAANELSPMVTGIIYCNVIHACQQVYALGRAREWTNALKAWCEAQAKSFPFTGVCLVYRAEVMQMSGEWSDAIAEASRAAERLVQSADPRMAAAAFYQQAELHRLRGELAEAEKAYTSASRWGWEPQPGLALLRLAQGRTEAAASAMRRVVGAATDRMQRCRLMPAHVEIMIAAGDLEEARRAAAELDDVARAFDIEVVEAMAAHARGSVALAGGDARSALEPLRRSFEIWQRLGAPYLAARVRVALAQACFSLGDEDGCRLECESAMAVFRDLGARPDLDRLEAAKTVVRPATQPSRPHRLSARELQVLRLVASGKTNKAIAAELFLSEKTVDRHLSNIFDKLDVSSRSAATAFAYEHSLI
ncbi:MAG TPA: LuxR C-terminal-related transcriptional regulator [Thermoanaerobaculia bacterium]